MNGDQGKPQEVTAVLPSGKNLMVQVAGATDGMESVGIGDRLDLDDAVDTVAELGELLFNKLKAIKPTTTSIELSLGFTVEAGKLTALIVNGSAEASLTLTLEWSE